ncbi:hypothetical protein FVR03_15880 [Pontibacter qinzhouensis]|uniref:Uncharacterized protein n=1 Tax=Pontibacter qinzhouensis TaxID=2603253 RepID=A0A5C8JFF0_9BACT|nr:hypothetical protein [Pontibacter qinzhouensis]TXK37175.1 hypothetical protein FVR03_15880 [Pontibacter qinzhouensis]
MRFYRNLAILTVVLIPLLAFLQLATGPGLVHAYIWYMLAFFVFVTGFAYYITNLGVEQDADNFQVYYFSAMGFRLLLCIAVIFAYVYIIGEQQLQFVLNFFILYFLFTGFEIYSLLANLRPHLKK